MGRIDEALRRAAENERRRSQPVNGSGASVPEVFPQERPDPDLTPRQVEEFPSTEPLAAVRPPAGADLPSSSVEVAGPLMKRLNATLTQKVVVDVNMAQSSREQYRRLAATLHQTQALSGLKVVMIASAAAGEG
jgi:hypothetical protein